MIQDLFRRIIQCEFRTAVKRCCHPHPWDKPASGMRVGQASTIAMTMRITVATAGYVRQSVARDLRPSSNFTKICLKSSEILAATPYRSRHMPQHS